MFTRPNSASAPIRIGGASAVKSFDQWLMTTVWSLFIITSKVYPKNGVKFRLAGWVTLDSSDFDRL